MKNIDKVVKIACIGFIAICGILVLTDALVNGSGAI
jgi:hypothetical protein